MNRLQFLWILWAAIVFAAVGCDPAGKSAPVGSGQARVNVVGSSLSTDDIATLQIVVTGDDFAPGITTSLLENPENMWSGIIADIPAGDSRTFTARAFDAEGKLIYRGIAADVTVETDKTAVVNIFLQQTGTPDPFANAVPVITAFTASSQYVEPGETVAFTVAAADANQDTLSYQWAAETGSFNCSNANETVWTAPEVPGTSKITVLVSDPQGATATISADITVAYENTGDAAITIQINTAPEMKNLLPTPARVDAGETTTLDLTAVDRDGNALSYVWNADCDGTFNSSTVEDPTFTLNSISGNTCVLTVTVSDGMGGTNTASVTIETGAGIAIEYLETDTDSATDNNTDTETGSEVVCTTKTFSFQTGVDSYDATTDIEILQSDADSSFPANSEMSIDQRFDNGIPDSASQVLLRFDGIWGAANSIPDDATISEASLTVYSVNRTANNISLYQMLVDWPSDATWNSLNGGVTADNAEALQVADDTLIAPGYYNYFSFDVTDAVMNWHADATTNFGWVFMNDGTDGWDILSSESFDITMRPKLTITAEVCGAPEELDTDSASDTDTVEETVPYGAYTIGLTPGSDGTELNFAWYSTSGEASMVQLALKADMTGDDFPEASAIDFEATVTAAVSGYYSNRATATSLSANTAYVYRVGNGTNSWSGNFYCTTGSDAFSFMAVGDPQIGAGSVGPDTTGWTDTLDKALAKFPETDFIMSAGDQVNTRNNEDQFSGFFAPDVLRSIPVAPALGNHDTGALNTAYHFNMPNLSAEYGVTDPGSSDYYFIYGDALFVILNSNNKSGATHEAFISETVAAHPDVKWKIAMFHHDIYGSAYHALETSIQGFRAVIFPVFDEYDFDIVITGHDHSYSRSHVLYGDLPQLSQETDEDGAVVNPNGTVYFTLNSATGSKYYSLNMTQADYCAFRSQAYVPTFSYVTIDGDKLSFDTYQTDTMTVIDSFGIVKTDN